MYEILKKINRTQYCVGLLASDTSVLKAKIFDKFQFERIGYFSVDIDRKPNDKPDDNTDADIDNVHNIVMNMTVALKNNKKTMS